MDRLHENVMDELLNGDERRAALAEQVQQQAYQASRGRQQAKSSALGAGYGNVQQVPVTAADLQQQVFDMHRQMSALGQSASGLFDSAQQSLSGDDMRAMHSFLNPTPRRGLMGAFKNIMKGDI
jgi:hypothetical protein